MKDFFQIKAFDEEFEVYHLPASRIIGREVRNGGTIGNTAPALWAQVCNSGEYDTLLTLPRVLQDSTYGWTCEYDKKTDTFVYMVCTLTPADTPVPDGFTYRDIPETLCAKGLYGESVMQTLARAQEAGYANNWANCGWNAELYLRQEEDNPPRKDCDPWRWIVPVKKI